MIDRIHSNTKVWLSSPEDQPKRTSKKNGNHTKMGVPSYFYLQYIIKTPYSNQGHWIIVWMVIPRTPKLMF
jgi:hypothetical protein